jgi:cytochrome c-type biogenesis protein CcmF
MTIVLGNVALAAALIAAAVALLAAMVAARFDSAAGMRAARMSLITMLGTFTLAAMLLAGAMIDSDFHLAYVARFTERALPTGYKLAAFWAGQEGSLLLWGWLIAAMAVIHCGVNWKKVDREQAVTAGTLAVIGGFFAALMLFAANPFAMGETVPVDGHGLNPMLQDPGMIAHPPLLFLGYAGFAIPFAIMFGALWTGRRDNQWLGGVRRWAVVAWTFLTVGILLGARWAYVELGWGGYWAWDPVENASLLPWLTGTALLHSIMVQQKRGMLKFWSAALIALTFVLCIFGTYITRSGIVDSVHTFGKSLVGTFFLVFMLATIVGGVALIVVRRRLLKSEHELAGVWGREGAFLAVNVLLLAMTAITAVGTIFPVISQAFTGRSVSVGQPFYNKVVVPMGLCLMALMAFGPLLNYGKGAADDLKKHVKGPLLGGALTAATLALVWRIGNPWALLTAFIVGVAAVSIVWDIAVTVARRVGGGAGRENVAVAFVRTVDANHRRYGGQTVHVGMLMIMVGIAGSSVYGTKSTIQLSPGGVAVVDGGWRVTLDKLDEVRGANYGAVEATVSVRDPRNGEVTVLRPQRRFYDKAEDSNSEVANWSTWRRDAYVTLAGWEDGGRLVALEMYVNPLVAWLWIGGIFVTAGAVLCLLPRLIPHAAVAVVEQQAATVRKGQAGRPAKALQAVH